MGYWWDVLGPTGPPWGPSSRVTPGCRLALADPWLPRALVSARVVYAIAVPPICRVALR